ncbi:MAG: hypothetical protein U0835_11375 [Isosphaeraceae bacterium]
MVFTGWPWASWSFPLIWAQGVGPRGAATPSGPLVNPNALAPLALRRWFGSLTLCSPDSVPGLYPLFLWLAALGFLAFLVLLFQGPFSALRQLLDLSGHARVFRDATGRLRRSGRMLALTVGLTVLSWTGSQSLSFNAPQGREDQLQITRSRSLVELGFEQGALAALTPLRDVAGLGSNLPMLALAVVILFRATAENWGAGNPTPGMPRRERTSGWATVVWFCGGGYIVYRIIALAQASPDLPLGNCLMIEPAVIPLTMLVCDGILLAWVVTELRDAGFVRQEGAGFDVNAPLSLMPAASLACLAALPARYLATAVFLVFLYLPGAVRTAPGVGTVLRWQSIWGNADVQAAALAFCGIAGSVVWSGAV